MCSTYSLPIQSWNEETKMEEERKRFGNCLYTVKENCNKSVQPSNMATVPSISGHCTVVSTVCIVTLSQ